MTKEMKRLESIPYNVLHSKVSKVAIASSLVTGFAVTGVLDLVIPGIESEKVKAAGHNINFSSTESTSQEQIQTFTIPDITKLNSVTSLNGGNVEVLSVNGDQVTVKMTGGTKIRTDQTGGEYIPADTKYISGQTSSNYNSNGYVGTLEQYVESGEYIPTDSKEVTDSITVNSNIFNNDLSYNSDGYVGTLFKDGGPTVVVTSGEYSKKLNFSHPLEFSLMHYEISGNITDRINLTIRHRVDGGIVPRTYPIVDYDSSKDYILEIKQNPDYPNIYTDIIVYEVQDTRKYLYTQKYKGTVTKPGYDTRVFKYRGNITKPDSDTRTYADIYQYNLTFDYETDNTAPTITLTPNQTSPTNVNISVEVNALDSSGVSQVKWARGNQPVSYFATAGNSILSGESFEVTENDVYTVYAKDTVGNETVQTVNITNLDFVAPVITLTPSKTTMTNVAIDVDVDVVDNNPIIEKKWAKGDLTATYVATNGISIVGNRFNVSENGTYTVYAIDAAGNESIQTITIANIDMVKPDMPLFEADITAPTKNNVMLTITFPDDTVVQEYKVGSGAWSWQAYTGPIEVSENATIYARGKDEAGNYSDDAYYFVSNIDKTAPIIKIKGIENGKTYVNETPQMIVAQVTDDSNVELTILLNGEPYNGERITQSGSYLYTVKAVDDAGNEALESIGFHVNHTPSISQTIANKTWKKFDSETIDLSTIFKDTENDTLTYTVTTSDPSVIAYSITGNELTVEAIKQGNASVSITANDGYSDSIPVTFDVTVNSVVPIVSYENNITHIVSDGNDFTIEGLLIDKDKDNVELKLTIDGNTKTTSVLTTGGEDSWSFSFDGAEISTGVHKVSVEATDPTGANAILESEKFIVKLPVEVSIYGIDLSKYESDLKKDSQDFSLSEHNVLLEAFIAVNDLKAMNNPTTWSVAKGKIDELVEGTLKQEYTQLLTGNAFDYLIAHFDVASKSDYVAAGIKNVSDSLVSFYNVANSSYQTEIGTSTPTVVQLIVDVENAVEQAKQTNAIDDWKIVIGFIDQLQSGSTKDSYLQIVEDGLIKAIELNPTKFTNEVAVLLNLTVDSGMETDYQLLLSDVLVEDGALTKSSLQSVISNVQTIWDVYNEAINLPSKLKVEDYEESVNALLEGSFKSKMITFVDDVALSYLVASPTTQDTEDYARMGITLSDENLASYNMNMAKYVSDIGASNFSLSEVQKVVQVTYKVDVALSNSTTAHIQQALNEVRSLVDGTLKTALTASLNGEVIDGINLNPGTITADDLINLGIERVNPDLEKDYQDALTKLKEDLGGTLTFDDIQNAIDAVNAVDKALKTGDSDDIQAAIDAINKLPNGTLKDDLLNKIKDLVANDILQKPSKVTVEKLVIAGFKDVDSTLEEAYKEALINYVQPLTIDTVQQLIDVVNQVKKTRLDLTLEDRNKLSDMVSKLSASPTKVRLTIVYNALNQLNSLEQNMNADNIKQASDLVALIQTHEHGYLELMVNSFDKVFTSLIGPSDESVGLAQTEISKLENGKLKSRLQERVGGAYLEHVLTSPGDSSYSDWVNAGFENVKEDDLQQYKDAVKNITNEVGHLTKEQIQAIVDAINAMIQAKANPTNQTIQNAKAKIQLVVDSKWKTGALAEMDALWVSIQPKPNPPVEEVKPIPPVIQPPTEVKPAEPIIPPEIDLPTPSEKIMMVQNDKAAVIMEIPEIEVSESSELKVKIKIHAKDILEGSKLYIYADSANSRGLGAATLANANPGVQLIGENGKMVEIDFGKMDKGMVEIDRNLVFGADGEYILKGIFVANGTNLETNKVKVSVFKELLIPNTVLPNVHGLPVATLKATQDIALYEKDNDGNFIRSGSVKKDTLHAILDTEKGYYKLADGKYAKLSPAITVHIGKGEVRKDSVNVYDKNGRFLRVIKKGQQYKVYSYDSKRYNIGGGEYIELQDGVTYVFGWMTVETPTTLYKADGSIDRVLNKGEKYRVYQADAEYLHLGVGYKVRRDNNKFNFLKN